MAHYKCDEQITVFHLILQVYRSPSLKEQVYNPVMPLAARTIERKDSILRAHGGVCVCVCGGCVNICMYVCALYVGVWLCVHIHLCQCIQNNGQVQGHVSVITQVQ